MSGRQSHGHVSRRGKPRVVEALACLRAVLALSDPPSPRSQRASQPQSLLRAPDTHANGLRHGDVLITCIHVWGLWLQLKALQELKEALLYEAAGLVDHGELLAGATCSSHGKVRRGGKQTARIWET